MTLYITCLVSKTVKSPGKGKAIHTYTQRLFLLHFPSENTDTCLIIITGSVPWQVANPNYLF